MVRSWRRLVYTHDSVRSLAFCRGISSSRIGSILVAVGIVLFLASTGVAAATSASTTDLTTENGTVTLGTAPGQLVTGTSDHRPGTTLSIQLELDIGGESFTATEPAVVDEKGEFRAVYNLSAIPEATPGRAIVEHDDEEVASAASIVTGCNEPCTDRRSETVAGAVLREPADARFEAGPGRVVRLDTALPAGTSVRVRLTSGPDASGTFVMGQGTSVDENGVAVAVFDLSDDSYVGSPVRLSARHDGSQIIGVNGSVVKCNHACRPHEPTPPTTPVFSDTLAENPTILLSEPLILPVELNDAGRATLHLYDTAADNGFELNATVTDGTGDNRVDVVFDPAASGEDVVFPAATDDTVVIDGQTNNVTPGVHFARLRSESSDSSTDFRSFRINPDQTNGSREIPSENQTRTPLGTFILVGMVLLIAGSIAVLGVGVLIGIVDIRW